MDKALIVAFMMACSSMESPGVSTDVPPGPPGTGPEVPTLDTLKERYFQRVALRPHGTITGRLTALDGAPIHLATVSLGRLGLAVATNENGEYSLEEVPFGSHVLTFEHPDYVLTQRPANVRPDIGLDVSSRLIRRSEPLTFDAQTGAVLKVGPFTLTFEPDQLVARDGSIAQGTIEIVATAIDPRLAEHLHAAPAPLEGMQIDGSRTGLFSFGMIEVEMSQGGQKVNVKPGKKVEVALEIDPRFPTKELKTIPLWHHDLEEGIWVQERDAHDAVIDHRDGETVAVARLPHFSQWNFDVNYTTGCGTLFVPVASGSLNGIRTISTTDTGMIDTIYNWSVRGSCRADSPSSWRCVTNMPANTSLGHDPYFKIQAQMNTGEWCDLQLIFNSTVKTNMQASDIDLYYQNNPAFVRKWCGMVPTNSIIADFREHLTVTNIADIEYHQGGNNLVFGTMVNQSSCATLGAGAVTVDPGYSAMAANMLSTDPAVRADVDQDGQPDRTHDNCSFKRLASQSDSNGNGIGDACEPYCFVAPGPFSSWFDGDGDGVDNLCDNRPTTFNPAQY